MAVLPVFVKGPFIHISIFSGQLAVSVFDQVLYFPFVYISIGIFQCTVFPVIGSGKALYRVIAAIRDTTSSGHAVPG